MAQVVPSETYSLASAVVDGLAESLEAPETLDLVLENAGVHEPVLLELVAAADLALLASEQVSQSSIAERGKETNIDMYTL